ncbi:MAG: peptidoglycan-binding protein [Sphingomonadales bacterium]|nr:MAG: peptidoglycan-binding protein [Sphingomonadales bacterium]
MTIIDDDAFVRLFQERAGLDPVDGWAGTDTIAALDKAFPPPRPPASVSSQIPDDYWPMLSKIESGDRPYIQAALSSASGLYQFIRSTWEGEGGAWGPTLRPAFGGLKPSVEEQLARAKTFTAKNAAYLAKQGIPINKASLYAAHFFGSVTAAKVIGADVSVSAEALAGPAATKANPSILKGKTVGEFLTWLHKKTGDWAR